jgi:hypothetical protein
MIRLGKARRLTFPGLKPWAVFRSSFGRLEYAQENVQTAGHFVPGYDRTVPPGHMGTATALNAEMSKRHQALRAWLYHAVPPGQKPFAYRSGSPIENPTFGVLR